MENENSLLFIANGFPSLNEPSKCPFNLRAAEQLSEYFHVTVLTLRSWRFGRKMYDEYVYQGINVICISLPLLPWQHPKIPYSDSITLNYFQSNVLLNVAMKLIPACILNKFKLIHSVSFGFPGLLGYKISKKYDIPHFLQIIGTDVNAYLPQVFSKELYYSMVAQLKGIIANSYSLKNSFDSFYPKARNKSEVIYRGTRLDFFYPQKVEDIGNIKYLFLGGFHPSKNDIEGNKKGGNTLLKAWLKYEDIFLKYNAELVVGGSNANVGFLSWFLRKLKAPNNVQIIGLLSPLEVKEYLIKTDVVIIPSLNEGLPNLAMEAIACGKPIIGANVGGLPEIVINEQNGYLFPAEDINELAKKMIYFLKGNARLSQLGQNARKTAEEKFDSSKYGASLKSFYENKTKGILNN